MSREIAYLRTVCKNDHVVKLKPSAIIGNRAYFGSAADHCKRCEATVVESTPVYVSRQLKWQRERVARGLCRHCGRRRAARSETSCSLCRRRRRVERRKATGHSPWRPGSRGRKPLDRSAP